MLPGMLILLQPYIWVDSPEVLVGTYPATPFLLEHNNEYKHHSGGINLCPLLQKLETLSGKNSYATLGEIGGNTHTEKSWAIMTRRLCNR